MSPPMVQVGSIRWCVDSKWLDVMTMNSVLSSFSFSLLNIVSHKSNTDILKARLLLTQCLEVAVHISHVEPGVNFSAIGIAMVGHSSVLLSHVSHYTEYTPGTAQVLGHCYLQVYQSRTGSTDCDALFPLRER